MIQGTGSSVGKSIICAALLRMLKQDGHRVAPFKAQNMALNSFATKEGLEMGRAQVLQAQAAGIEPSVLMNPVLLKPTSDRRSQVIVNGKPIGNMTAMEYHLFKPRLQKFVQESYDALESTVDFVVIEGAGSPAEINLRDGDIVNMAMAEMADAPVLLAGDINLGGVFASLYGTVMLLTEPERARVKGVLINKFRGDREILSPGLTMLEDLIQVPVAGVVPWMDVDLEDEDSVTDRFQKMPGAGDVDVAVVRLPHISNFTDFQALSLMDGVRVRYIERASELEGADVIILPGTKNTIEDLLEIQSRGISAAVVCHARAGGLVIGVCGGYQMLGCHLTDPYGVESQVREVAGLGLIDMEVTFLPDKTTVQASGMVSGDGCWLEAIDGAAVDGYEIHAGVNRPEPDAVPWLHLTTRAGVDGLRNPEGNVLGSYLHGLFDNGHLCRALAGEVRRRKGLSASGAMPLTMEEFRERELDRLASVVRASLDMDLIYKILRGEA
jgi:adenosylcobyric acid synthase